MTGENVTDPAKQRERIVERARALLSMTVQNGCTEAEAMTAAAKAAKLMEEYDLALGDIKDVQDTRVAQQSEPMQSTQNRKHMHAAGIYAAVAIGDFFDCRCWRDQVEIIFFGAKDDVMLAHVTLNMVRVAMDRELEVFLQGPALEIEGHPATLKASFLRGMGDRISGRFIILKQERTEQARSRGNELVVLKGALVDAEFAKLFPHGLGRANQQKPTGNDWAYSYGAEAADGLNLLTKEVEEEQSENVRAAARATPARQRRAREVLWTPGGWRHDWRFWLEEKRDDLRWWLQEKWDELRWWFQEKRDNLRWWLRETIKEIVWRVRGRW
ncbi:MAG: hypothetical protein ACI9XZ_004346 [Alphaproteobacteria bacterium]|jgi:hypothetical protein